MKFLKFTKILALLLALTLLLGSCDVLLELLDEPAEDTAAPIGDTAAPAGDTTAPEETEPPVLPDLPEEGGAYYDVWHVVMYLEIYGQLPPNYITKKEAQALGWTGGSVEQYKEGAAIGGDRFGNYEGLLPAADGRTWTECDIDTLGYGSRGSRRLVFSNDGLYFYTDDHYESFREVTVYVDSGAVSW